MLAAWSALLNRTSADALVAGFGAHWMGLPELVAATPDPTRFPLFDEPLRDAMREELMTKQRRSLWLIQAFSRVRFAATSNL